MSKRKNKKIKKNSLSTVFTVRFIKERTKIQQILSNIVDCGSPLHGNELDIYLKDIFRHPLCPTSINCRYKKIEDSFTNYIFNFRNFREELIWLKNLFIINKNHLNSFLIKKKELEIKILNSNTVDAFRILEDIEQNISFSIWGIETKSHIKKELLKEESSEYLNSVRNQVNHHIMNFFIQQILLKSESQDIYSFIDNLKFVLKEIRNTKANDEINTFADMASSYFIPYEYDMDRDVNSRSFTYISNYSIIDQYLLFKSFIIENKLYGEAFPENEQKIINEIVFEIIEDEELINLYNDVDTLSDINTDYMSIIKDYTISNYKKCHEKMLSLIKTDINAMCFIELYARCNIHLNLDNKTVFYEKISHDINNILMCNNKALESIYNIEKIAIKFKFSLWTIPLLVNLYRYLDENKDLMKQKNKEMALFGKKITPYNLDKFEYKELIKNFSINEKELVLHRQYKLIDIDNLDNDSFTKFYIDLESEIEIYSDYICLYANSLLNRKMYVECVEFIVNTYLKNSNYYIILPIRRLLNIFESEGIEYNEIYLSILYDIFNRKIDSCRFDEYIEKFQDFIDSFETYLPSEIFKGQKLGTKEKYFLKNICIPEVMDVYPEYKSTENLKKERINVLDILVLNSDEKDSDYSNYISEKIKLFDEIIFEQLNTDFESSKIYVDLISLRNMKEDLYRYLFETYQISVKNHESNEKDGYVLLDKKDKESWIPITDLGSLIRKIYLHLLGDFVNNTDYGLDKYLSTDIRHGFFVTNLRTSVEECFLITEINDKNVYDDNYYWLNKYSIINDDIKNHINSLLKEFSRNFDTLLKDTNDWFKIRNEEDVDPGKGLFDFTPKRERLDNLKKVLENVNDFESFFESLISFMWDITDEATVNTKNQLDTVLRPNIIKLFDKLEEDIINAKQTIPCEDLLTSIQKSKYNVSKDLDRILNWFNCVRSSNDIQVYDLKSVLKTSVNTYLQLKKTESINIVFNNHETGILIVYREIKALTSAFYTALVNATLYKIENTNIDVDIIDGDNKIEIYIKNKFKLPQNVTNIDYENRLKQNFSSTLCNLTKTEGGSGLHKIYNLVINASDKFSFNIKVEKDETFIAIIGIKI